MAQTHFCHNCGDQYKNTKARNSGFCGAECRDLAKIKEMTRPCEVCNNDFVARRSTARFCSNACKARARRAREAAKREEARKVVWAVPRRRENLVITTRRLEQLIAYHRADGISDDYLMGLAKELDAAIEHEYINVLTKRIKEMRK